MISEKRMAIKFLIVVVVLVCVFVSGDDAVEVSCIASEREALLNFKDGLIDEYEILSSWRGEECCKWYGVVCNNTTGHVIKLQLDAFDFDDGVLQGQVDSSLLELHHLYYLDLSHNDFGGNPIPEFIGSMKQLQHLSLWESNFYGIVPPQIGNLTNLRWLDLSYNSLRTPNLDWLSSLPLLSFLDLSQINLSHTNWLHQIPSLHSLHKLRLESCNLRDLKPSFLELHHLNHLDLSHNDFGGNPIPEFIGSMKQLQHLSLWDSNFDGIVPPQIGNLTNLRWLDLSYNSLRTQNLDWLSTLPLLSFLDLSQIDLSHTNWLPHILSLHSLDELHLASCKIGDVNSSATLFFNYSSISPSFLHMSDNHLTWSSFDWLSNISTSLVKLDLSSNAFDGPIPKTAFERINLLEHLDLSNNTLEGEIPKSLVNLSRLRILVLYKNDLRGQFDELFGNLSGKGLLGSLEILDLAENHLNGSVPDLRAFSALTEVYLGGNNFTGSMPLSIGQLSNLHILEISHNSLEGLISESHFIKLDKLKILDLSFNSISLDIPSYWIPPFQLEYIFLAGCNAGPSFPKWIQSQRSFIRLDLSRASIIDEVPRWLWSTSSVLEVLLLSDNQISGNIPSLSSTSIMTIDLTNNNLSGPITSFNASAHSFLLSGNMFTGSISSICEIPHRRLWKVDLSYNKLAGEIPNCWENVPNLFSLNLADNSFSGEIPPSLGSLHDLGILQLRGNNLSGELPSTLRFCQNLGLIDIGGNKLRGEIPAWIGEMHKKIKFLNLARNKFLGGIPPHICNLTHIRILDLSVNNLSGKIPNCFNNFTSMAEKDTTLVDLSGFGFGIGFKYNIKLPNDLIKHYYEYSSIQWKGQELEYKKNLLLLKLIDFSSNRLTGSFPQSFSSMRGLISLNLSRNSLTGSIIPNIGKMEMLECLDLSNNQFSGKIPTSLAQLQHLAVLHLSNNNLFGRIPTSTQLQSFNTYDYAENAGLCGPPLALCPEDSLRPPTINPEDEKDRGLSFMQEVCISMGFGFIFGFWGFVGSLILKKSWRIAFFNFFDDAGDWFYARTAIFLSKMKRRPS